MIFAPGSVIDKRYEILESLGEGGFGTVYKARELSLDRLVALKFLHDDVRDTKSIGRFEREGKVLSKLSHPHIVKFYRFGLVGENVPYIAMEFVQGRSLRSLLDDTPQLPLQQFLKIAIQICDGLAAAHKEGIIHRDLKPSNIILMEEDNVKVVDFGVAKIINEDSDQCAKITQTGALIGSVFYMAPEQCLGAKIDHRIDIYALGCILYEMLTGSTPFVADENMAVILKHLKNEPQSITTLPNAKPVPEGLNNILLKALAKDPQHRYQSAQELKDSLILLQNDRGNEIPPPEMILEPKKSSLIPLTAVVTGLILMAASIATFIQSNSRSAIPTSSRSNGLTPRHLPSRGELLRETRSRASAVEDRISFYRSWLHQHDKEDSLTTATAHQYLAEDLYSAQYVEAAKLEYSEADRRYKEIIDSAVNAHREESGYVYNAYLGRVVIADTQWRATDSNRIAIEALTRCSGITNSPQARQLYLSLAATSFFLRRYKDAAFFTDKVIQDDGTSSSKLPLLRLQKARALYSLGDHRTGDQEVSLATELSRKWKQPAEIQQWRYNLALTLDTDGKAAEAVNMFLEVRDEAKKNRDLDWAHACSTALINLWDRMNQPARAINELKELSAECTSQKYNEILRSFLMAELQNNPTSRATEIVQSGIGFIKQRQARLEFIHLLESEGPLPDAARQRTLREAISRFKEQIEKLPS